MRQVGFYPFRGPDASLYAKWSVVRSNSASQRKSPRRFQQVGATPRLRRPCLLNAEDGNDRRHAVVTVAHCVHRTIAIEVEEDSSLQPPVS